MKPIWSQEEKEILVKNYEYTRTRDLLKLLPNKTNDQIRWKSKQYKLTKKVSKTKTDIEFLENFDDKESLYWWGFLTSDGCITQRQIIFSLHEKDKEHVIRFANKCKTTVSYPIRINNWHKVPYTMARTVVQDKFVIQRLIKLLNIQKQKTYNPFDISIFCTKERLVYYFCGLVDGDGHVSTTNCIKIKVHPNWLNNFKLISEKLKEFYDINSSVYLTKDNWAVLSISNKRNMRILTSLIIGKIPVMDRKWDRIKYS